MPGQLYSNVRKSLIVNSDATQYNNKKRVKAVFLWSDLGGFALSTLARQ